MPNGGLHFCAGCSHFLPQESTCSLRSVWIDIPYRTTCRNFNQSGASVRGPLYAMVSESKNGSAWHVEIPYYDGCRPDTVPLPMTGDAQVRFTDDNGRSRESSSVEFFRVRRIGPGDTVVRFTDGSGETREFSSAEDYIRFCVKTGREL